MTDRADLSRAIELRYAAMTAGDAEALAELLHEELVYTHSRGNRDTYASYLARVSAGELAYGPIEHRDEIRPLGDDVAMVVGEMRVEATVRGQSRPLANAFLGVWTRAGGRWQMVAYQPTPLPGG